MQIAQFSLFKISGSFSCNSNSSIWFILSYEVGVGLSLIKLPIWILCVNELYYINVTVPQNSELRIVREELLGSSWHFKVYSLVFDFQLAFKTQRANN